MVLSPTYQTLVYYKIRSNIFRVRVSETSTTVRMKGKVGVIIGPKIGSGREEIEKEKESEK